MELLGISPGQLLLVKQVHGRTVLNLNEARFAGAVPEADGLITARRGIALGMLTADCIPVFFYEPDAGVIALVHAGWRGVYAGILEEAVGQMKQGYGLKPDKIQVFLGPAIRKCCYEVGDEFKDFFPDFYVTRTPDHLTEGNAGKGYFDLLGAAKSRLIEAGIRNNQIVDSEICTSCSNGQFFSARREKTPERILSVIFLKPIKPSGIPG